MLDIQTFDNRRGGNVLYKALAHPLAAERLAALAARLAARGPVALFDPEGIAAPLLALHPGFSFAEAYVQDIGAIGTPHAGLAARPISDLPASPCAALLVAGFDAGRILARLRPLAPEPMELASLDEARLPAPLATNPRRALDPLNYATNFVFFRDQGGLSTRLVSANYWQGYGARSVRLWLRLYDQGGGVLAEWEEPLPAGPGGVVIDSRAVRARFALPPFTGQLFLHAIGAAGHDVVKYALDTFASDGGPSLSCTHDANAWPAERYAGLPAPDAGERVILWLQNSHASPIPAGAVSLDRMGAERPVALAEPLPGFATRAIDVAAVLPGLAWPAQIEVRAGRHVVRPRYEVVREGRTRIAHVNVERADLRPDPAIPGLSARLGRGFLLPFPVLARGRLRTEVQPTPMAHRQASLPLRIEIFDPAGRKIAERFLGNLPRDHRLALDLDTLLAPDALAEGGHGELLYDFQEGGEADGWLHALVRFTDRASGHQAETSFGAHIFNTLLTWRDEPQSYAGPPPGLSTRLFLKLGDGERRSFSVLIYPASLPFHKMSDTYLILHDSSGAALAEARLAIACSGSALVRPHESFRPADLAAAGEGGYVLIRDATCRLFGYHGLEDGRGGFSLDHMFGF